MRMFYLIIIGIILIACLAFTKKPYATTWAGTASNQCITGLAMANAITTGVFPSGCATSVFTDLGLRLLTKLELSCFSSINVETTTLAAKTNNQLLVKSDFVEYTNSISTYSRADGTYTTACVVALLPATGGLFYTIYYNGTLGIGTRFRAVASLSGRDAALKIVGLAEGLTYTLIDANYDLYEVATYCEP